MWSRYPNHQASWRWEIQVAALPRQLRGFQAILFRGGARRPILPHGSGVRENLRLGPWWAVPSPRHLPSEFWSVIWRCPFFRHRGQRPSQCNALLALGHPPDSWCPGSPFSLTFFKLNDSEMHSWSVRSWGSVIECSDTVPSPLYISSTSVPSFPPASPMPASCLYHGDFLSLPLSTPLSSSLSLFSSLPLPFWPLLLILKWSVTKRYVISP